MVPSGRARGWYRLVELVDGSNFRAIHVDMSGNQ